MSVQYRKREGRFVVDTAWPDGLRTRFRRATDDEAKKLDLSIQLSKLDDTWSLLRASLQMDSEEPLKLASGLFRDVADVYYSDYVLTHNRSAKAKKGFLERFKVCFGRLPFRSLTLKHVDRYVATRKKEDVKNSTINRELAVLRHLCEWGIKRGYVTNNPLEMLERLEEQEWAGPKPTEVVIRAVFSMLDPNFLPIYVVIRETGARRDEVLSLQHWQIDRERRTITFAKRTKNGKNTVAPLTERAIEAIDKVPVLAGCPYVFYNPETGTRWYDARKPWVAARNAAGYPWLRVRDLRPAFGIEAAERGVPMHFIRSALGHSSVAVTERYYAKFAPDAAATALRETLEAGRRASDLAQSMAQGEEKCGNGEGGMALNH